MKMRIGTWISVIGISAMIIVAFSYLQRFRTDHIENVVESKTEEVVNGKPDTTVFESVPDPAQAAVPEPQGTIASSVPIFMYHYIRSYVDPSDTVGENLSVSSEAFEKQIAWLKENGYETVSMDSFVHPKPLAGKPIVLTFDDGYQDAYDTAFPLLRRYGMTGTFYIITDKIGTPGYLTWDEVSEMRAAGMIFGSHTLSHPDLKTLPSGTLKREIIASKKLLEQKLGGNVTDFCYPSGKYDDAVVAEVRRDGYKTAVTTHSGISLVKDDPFTLKRLRITEHTDIRALLISR